MAYWVNTFPVQTWPPEFNPQNQHKDRGEKPTPQSCPRTCMHALHHMCVQDYMYNK